MRGAAQGKDPVTDRAQAAESWAKVSRWPRRAHMGICVGKSTRVSGEVERTRPGEGSALHLEGRGGSEDVLERGQRGRCYLRRITLKFLHLIVPERCKGRLPPKCCKRCNLILSTETPNAGQVRDASAILLLGGPQFSKVRRFPGYTSLF